MKVVRLVLVLTLVAEAARAKGQAPVLPPPNYSPNYSDQVYKIMHEEEARRAEQTDEWLACGRWLGWAIPAAAGAAGLWMRLRTVRTSSRVTRQAETNNAGQGTPAAPPRSSRTTTSTAVTEKPAPRGFPGPSAPTGGQDEPSRLARKLVLSNKLDEKALIRQLGAPTQTFKPCPVETTARLFLGVLFTGLGTAGLCLCSLGLGRASDAGWEIIAVLAMVAISAGMGGVLIWAVSGLFFRVSVCPAGIIQASLGRVAGAFWDQIKAVEQEAVRSPNEAFLTCRVHREDGFQFVRSHYPKGASKLVDAIVSRVR